MKTIFKEGDKVFDHLLGWGEVTEVDLALHHSVNVQYEKAIIRYTKDGRLSKDFHPTLSFTEYTLEGFSQKRPINYNDFIGKWGVFWDDGDGCRVFDILKHFYDRSFQAEQDIWYDNFKPLTDEQIKALEL